MADKKTYQDVDMLTPQKRHSGCHDKPTGTTSPNWSLVKMWHSFYNNLEENIETQNQT